MSLERIALPFVLILSACGAQISDGSGSDLTGIDGSGQGDGHGGGGGDGSGSGSGAPPVMTNKCGKRVVYLNYEGQTLTRGTMSDATQNIASWLTIAQGSAPAYHKDDADRATQIQTITDGVRSQLSTFPITVVTTRPTTGEYTMVVLGGKQNTIGSRFGSAVNTLDCGDAVANDVAWVSDTVAPTQHVINIVVGAVGFGIGLTATDDPDDCMCGWANACNSNDTTACKLGTAIDRDPTADQLCAGAGATQNEVTALHDSFCGK